MSARPPRQSAADSSLSTRAELRSVTTTTGIHRLGFIDGLRGLAAVYVVISHVWDTVFTRRPPSVHTLREVTGFLGFGRYAVTLFIVVSGFSIGLGAWRGGLRWPGGTKTYVRRRVRRIWPPYVAAVLISSLIAATVLSTDDGTLFDQANNIRVSGVLDHLLLLQDIHWAGPAGSSAFWSIAVEFHIYFVFLLVLAAMRRWSWAWMPAAAGFMLLTAASIAFPGVRVLHFLGGMSPSLYALFIVGFIAASAAVAHAPFDSVQWRRFLVGMFGLGCVLIIACRAHWVALSPLNDFLIGPVVAFVITQLVTGHYAGLERILSSAPLVWLGDCSYSLYLIHAVVIEIVWRVAVVPVTGNVLLRLVLELVLGVAASIVVARTFYLAFERPFLRASSKRRVSASRRSPAPGAAA
jgi:peptidoglycan/LPS O-acetylase OafA/YrhL